MLFRVEVTPTRWFLSFVTVASAVCKEFQDLLSVFRIFVRKTLVSGFSFLGLRLVVAMRGRSSLPT